METRPTPELLYLSKLKLLAKICNFDLDETSIVVMDELLGDLGYGRLSAALSRILSMRRGSDRFPSIRDIREAAGETFDEPKDDRSKATELANRVWDAIERFGYMGAEDAEKYLGPIGWAFVQNSGRWTSLCSIEGERTTYVAQWRDSIMSLLIKARAGIPLNTAPALSYAETTSLPEVVQKALQGAQTDAETAKIPW